MTEFNERIIEVRAAARRASVEPDIIEAFIACCESLPDDGDAALNALREHALANGKAGVIVSRRLGNVVVNWEKALKEARNFCGVALGVYGVAESFSTAVLTGAAVPWATAGGAVLGLLVCWNSLRGIADIELSKEHAKVVHYLWNTKQSAKVTLADVHASLDAEIDADRVSAILSDLNSLGLLAYNVDGIQRRTHLLLASG